MDIRWTEKRKGKIIKWFCAFFFSLPVIIHLSRVLCTGCTQQAGATQQSLGFGEPDSCMATSKQHSGRKGETKKKKRNFVYKALFCSTNHRTNIHAQPYTFYNMVITTSNAAVLLATFVAGAAGHGSMIMPPSRNSVDGKNLSNKQDI